jgi:hypothetical protein
MSSMLIAHHVASGGIIDLLSNKATALNGLFRLVSVVFGAGFVMWHGVVSRGAVARILIAGVAAGFFVWLVWNVTDVKNRVQNEVNSAPAPLISSVSAPHTLGLPGKAWSLPGAPGAS